MKILLAAFDPFGGESINPALEAVKKVRDIIEGYPVVKVEIPTVFHQSIRVLEEKMRETDPSIILVVGQAGGRPAISVERIGINIDDARIPDNQGNQPLDEKIVSGGPEAYFSNLPIKAMTNSIRQAGIPATVSNTAGTFVCNHILYGLLHHIHREKPKARGGFIHVPFIPSQVTDKGGQPSMAPENITKALEAALRAAVLYSEDIQTEEGSLH